MQYQFINGNIVSKDQAQLSVFDLGLLRGYGVFDFFKVHDGVPVFVKDHLARFYRSSELLNLKVPMSATDAMGIIEKLIEKNKINDGTFRLILTGGVSSNGISLDGPPTFIILAGALSFKIYHEFDQMKPLKLKIIDYVRETPEIKSLNYLVPMMHWPEIVQGGYDDVLYVQNGLISETSRANIFFLTWDNVLITPDKNVLKGITRKYILQLAAGFLNVEERPISLEEALTCKEAFLSSSTKQVMPVHFLDQHKINDGQPGELTKKLFELFYQFEMEFIATNKNQFV
ncbi:MAG: aminotransferase class IV [Saprospiraceae bacterium]